MSSALPLIGGVYIGARALLDNKFDTVWLYRSHPSLEEGDYFTRSNGFYLPLLRLEEGVGGQHPVLRNLLQ